MPLIDKTYFVGEINIPDISNASVLERLNFFIAKYEEPLLRTLLGNALYAAYAAGIAAETPDSKWTDLRDGKDYTDSNDVAQRWSGFRNETTKQSLIANYVYYWWLRDKASHTTTAGEVSTNSDGAAKVSPADKQARAWNELSEAVVQLVKFLDANVDAYAEWQNVNSCAILDDFAPINTFNI